jgi:hypothetical protein
MRPLLDEALVPLVELPAMSGEGPSNPLGHRPRMAEALASLKEGLRDTADPLYDGWRLQRRTSNADARPPIASSGSVPDPGETIDISLDESDEMPITDAATESSAPVTFPDASLEDAFPTEEGGIIIEEELIEPLGASPAVASRPSVQTDTVRVRVIRYQPFPRWALVVAAALVVFAVSLVAMRGSLPLANSRSTRSVLASEVPSDLPISSPAVATAPPAAARPADTPSAAPPPLPALEATTEPSPVPVQAPAPAGKMPSAPARRRPGTHDFFRDPGF